MCGPLQYSLYGTCDSAQNWEEELDTQRSQADERDRMPMRVARLHWGNRAQRRHHNRRRTIGGGISHQKLTRKIQDQEASDWADADFEKSGRTLNRVIEWSRDASP